MNGRLDTPDQREFLISRCFGLRDVEGARHEPS